MRTGIIPLAVALLAAPAAHAFCGTYVGGADGTLTNHYSRIVVARAGTLTTLTMINDVEGDLSQFGLVIPIPEAIDQNDVRLADRELIDRVDQYSSPRVVAYSCEDFYAGPDANAATPNPQGAPASSSSGCGGSSWGGDGADTDDGWTDTATGVDVVDHFELGEYEAFVLSSSGSDGLLTWLDANGFAVDAGTADLFQEYIDADNHFLALKVKLDTVPDDRGWLSPLQIRYNAEGFGLPIRMGARSSEGVQDLVVFALTEPSKGKVSVSNYPENPVASECLVPLEADMVTGELPSFADFYEAAWSETTGISDDPERARANPGLGWNTEYSWGGGKCDPCDDSGPLTTDEVQALGYDDAFYGYHLTRLHLRYTPEAVTQDLVFYESGITTPSQMRYVKHEWELESLFPMCGAEQPETPGTCFGSEYWARRAQGLDDEPLVHDDSYTFLGPLSGCQTPGHAALLLPLLLAWRRRRQTA